MVKILPTEAIFFALSELNGDNRGFIVIVDFWNGTPLHRKVRSLCRLGWAMMVKQTKYSARDSYGQIV